MTAYPQEDRVKARTAFRRFDQFAQQARQCAERSLKLPADVERYVAAVTGTSDINAQVKALTQVSDKIKSQHLDKLGELARGDFSAFCEFVNPEEPPESRWHVWLTQQLQEIELDPDLNKFVLNCPPGHAKPLHVDTPVLMADYSYKRLGDVVVGDWVISHTGSPRRVTAVHEQGELDLCRLTTASGRQVLGEGSHPFMTLDRAGRPAWCELGELVPGQLLVVEPGDAKPPVEARSTDPSDEADARAERRVHLARFKMQGYMACGGAITFQMQQRSLTPSQDFRLSTSKRAIMSEVQACAEALDLRYSICSPSAQTAYILRPSVFGFRELCDASETHEGWFSYKPEDRIVPPHVFGGDDEEIAAFLSGALSIRAEVLRRLTGRNLRLRHRSEAFVRGLQRLCARIGVAAEIKLPDPEFGGAFFLLIDQAGVDQLTVSGVDLSKVLTEALRTQRPLKSEAEGSAKSRGIAKLMQLRADPVVSVEAAGRGLCRCLTIETDHSFTADLLVVKNSTYASRLFVAWRLGRDPDQRIIGGGHGQTFVENEFSKKIKDLVGSPEYRRVFPQVVISHDANAKGQWGLAGFKGQYVARGVGQGIHGFRATFIVVDDPYSQIEMAQSATHRKKVELWFDGDLGSRALPECKQFLIMTRFHGEDLTHHLEEMNKILPAEMRWKIVSVPAICIDPDTDILDRAVGDVLWSYYGHDYFRAKKIEFGFQGFSLTYQQSASASLPDNLASKFAYYDVLPHLTDEALKASKTVDHAGRTVPERASYIRRTIVSVDTAAKTSERADYTVAQVWMQAHDGRIYLADQVRGKWEMGLMVQAIERLAKDWSADLILVEDKGQGTAYLQTRGQTDYQRLLAPCPLVPVNPGVQGKEFRLDAVATMITEGLVFLPQNAPWMDIFVQEVGQFPEGAHDDQVDSMSQALMYFKTNTKRFGAKKMNR